MVNQSQTSASAKLFNWLSIILLVYLVLVAVGTVSGGFKLASGGSEGAKEIFAFATNPVVALLLGALATALVQSSSTVTSVIVGLVAGGLPISIAIPMVMGANIGTTITNTLVSIGHIRSKEEFKRAFAASTVHDFFNLLAVVIFLPLEIMFGILEKFASSLAHVFVGDADLSLKSYNFIKPLVKPAVNVVKDAVSFLDSTAAGVSMVVIGIMMILFAVTYLGKLLKKALVGKAKELLHSAIGRGPLVGIGSGAVVTVMVQSSSTTTSLMIPLAGSGVFTTRQIYPFTLGANIGTTITALLAATSITGAAAEVALTIALVHVMFNVFAVTLIYGMPLLREIPLQLAEKIADIGSRNKPAALAYVLGSFFVFPGLIMLAVR
ncbi:Na/Pi symporter [Pseudoalteromonas sp. SCSIO 43201]|uniref:Solute carrier family 34 (Sodium-dependent phosphate cotransporter) n=1 Tax=Pseudoalteromonas peptidolytica F12-50-A1 TaxID=1315280 RepID=A0A8I0N0Z1_9GAMM|nr:MULTISPECIES: Na/Pi symporter [Pseudoalteromonas]MBE0348821.1 solute carrier family 34 (sodium-dependent phosphate cotransporter) [Pseudoalteromonas peptidolytica F12-50-A1]MDW7548682.1 Na/Pi symporter [Pseudoalteromonas peptidolytica]NLR16807.1 Na/Pi cotransporter family protein [Pseudoalteromonas peptidolytica]USD30586.1 Na/Pi symporter [Pseudoalteromonas sp. SCSIO 43201]GEK09060.1 sodium:phosphate symporter [Pseudoalteromonas peptidolytica]